MSTTTELPSKRLRIDVFIVDVRNGMGRRRLASFPLSNGIIFDSLSLLDMVDKIQIESGLKVGLTEGVFSPRRERIFYSWAVIADSDSD